jgi:DNA-binding XRE family transcriptional regulator
MIQDKNKYENDLALRRIERNLSRKRVSQLLFYSNDRMIERFENGHSDPPLRVALLLGALYRRPVEDLFFPLYKALRNDLRIRESLPPTAHPRQLFLF